MALWRGPSVNSEGLRARIEEAIKRLSSLTGVSMVLVIGPDGKELCRWYRTTVDRSRIVVGVGDAMGVAVSASGFLSKVGGGAFNDIIIRTERLVAIIQSARGALLITVADRAANLALLLIRSRAAAEALSELLGGRG